MATHSESRFPNRLLRLTHSAGGMQSGLHVGLRGAQLATAFIILGLTAYVADWYNADTLTMAPAQVSWQLTCSVISILSLGYVEGAKRFFPRAHHAAAALGLESANAVFHFSAFVYLAMFLSRLLFCRGSICAASRAATVFGAFEFLFWAASAVLAGRELAKNGGGVGGLKLSLPTFRRSPKSAGAAREKDIAMEEGASSRA